MIRRRLVFADVALKRLFSPSRMPLRSRVFFKFLFSACSMRRTSSRASFVSLQTSNLSKMILASKVPPTPVMKEGGTSIVTSPTFSVCLVNPDRGQFREVLGLDGLIDVMTGE